MAVGVHDRGGCLPPGKLGERARDKTKEPRYVGCSVYMCVCL